MDYEQEMKAPAVQEAVKEFHAAEDDVVLYATSGILNDESVVAFNAAKARLATARQRLASVMPCVPGQSPQIPTRCPYVVESRN